MRHKSRDGTVDASQSLYTKESFSHLFGIKKRRGREYKIPPNYETVVIESPVATQMDGTVVDSTLMDPGIAQPAVKQTDSAVVDSKTEDLKSVQSTMMNSSIAVPAIRQMESAIVGSETEDVELVRTPKINSGITRPDVPIAKPDTIAVSRYETISASPTITQTDSAVVDSEMGDLGSVDSTMMNAGTTPYVPVMEPDIIDLTLSPSPKYDTDGQVTVLYTDV